jgi:outer membrane receptor protein involved in Fe transport
MTRPLAIGFVLLTAGVAAQAQEQEQNPASTELSPIQVTAGRQPESQYQVPQPVTVLTGAEIDRLDPQVLAQALAYQPGAFFQQSGPGQGIVIVRGLKGSEVLHLVDGFRLNNAFFRNSPSQYVALVDPRNVAQLELLRGPNATIYGSDAMGGVFQVLTPEYRFDGPGWDLRGGAEAHYGSADLERSGRVELATGNSLFSVGGGVSYGEYGMRKLATDGQSPDGQGGWTLAERVNDTGYESRAYDVKLMLRPGAHEVMLATQSFEVPELQRYFQTVSGYGSAPPPRRIAEFRNDRRFYHLRYRYTQPLAFLEGLEAHVGRQVMTDDRLDRNNPASPGTPRDEFTFNDSTLDGVTLQAETGLGSQRLRYGVEFYTDEVRSSAYRETPPGSGVVTYPDGTSFFSPFPDGSRANDLGVWVLDEWHATDALLLEGGVRYSRHETDIARGDRAFGAQLRQDDFTGNVGARYALTESLAWTTNVGRGFRAPNLFDLALVGQRASNRIVVANLDLRPESVTTYDTGLKAVAGGFTSEFSVFYSDYADRIVTVNPAFAEGAPECPDDGDATTTGCAQNQNIAASRYYGFEGGTRWAVTEKVTARATLNYTWGDQEQGAVRTPANRVPPLNGLVAVELRPLECVTVEPWLFWAGRQERLDPNDLTDTRIHPAGTGGYAVVNLRLGWRPTPATRVQLDGSNLLDKAYREHGSGIDGPARGLGISGEWRF